jgi:hypothetical protein
METILSSLIALAITLFFVRRHVKTMPAPKPSARPARRKAPPGASPAPAREAA